MAWLATAEFGWDWQICWVCYLFTWQTERNVVLTSLARMSHKSLCKRVHNFSRIISLLLYQHIHNHPLCVYIFLILLCLGRGQGAAWPLDADSKGSSGTRGVNARIPRGDECGCAWPAVRQPHPLPCDRWTAVVLASWLIISMSLKRFLFGWFLLNLVWMSRIEWLFVAVCMCVVGVVLMLLSWMMIVR